jgi:IclR family transcriptional regulator, acetate operon repressor
MSSTSPAVGRALDLLLYLAARPGPVSGAAIARDLKIPRSSTYHLLDVLMARGFVVHFSDRRTYGLGMAAFEIGSAYLRHEPLEMLARPVLSRLAGQVNETAHLGVLHGEETLYLLKEQPALPGIPVTLVTDVGVRLPAHLTASGRAILAHLPAAQVRALFPRGFVDRTGHGPSTLPELRRVLSAERRQRWAEEIGLVTDGLQSVAACAFDHSGHPCAAISVTWRSDRARSPKDALVRGVRTAAQQLTWALGGRAPSGWFGQDSV